MIFYINMHILLSILYINFYLKSLININIANIATKMIAIKVVKSHDHHFKWWFAISPIRAILLARLKGGHCKPFTYYTS